MLIQLNLFGEEPAREPKKPVTAKPLKYELVRPAIIVVETPAPTILKEATKQETTGVIEIPLLPFEKEAPILEDPNIISVPETKIEVEIPKQESLIDSGTTVPTIEKKAQKLQVPKIVKVPVPIIEEDELKQEIKAVIETELPPIEKSKPKPKSPKPQKLPVPIIEEDEPKQEINTAVDRIAPVIGKDKQKLKVPPNVKVPKNISEDEAPKKEIPNIKKGQGRKSINDFQAEILTLNIPEDDILFSKQYYPISEVARMFNVNISLLRFWENEFDILKPRKNRKGDRLFRPEDVKNLKIIYFLLREKKYTIEGAKGFLKKGNKLNEKFEAIESLKKIKAMLLELKAGLSN